MVPLMNGSSEVLDIIVGDLRAWLAISLAACP